ncbi:MAG: aldehyde dehydrogenase family protein [Oscillospiraceae bacterium]|nr:aldehyde dehydrogenase family protein [Oscillospiraceae bacterium]
MQAAKAAVFGTYCHSGQVCMALNRVIATPKVYDALHGIFLLSGIASAIIMAGNLHRGEEAIT